MRNQDHSPVSPLLTPDIPLYMQVYTYYKDLITDGKLPPNTKLPSVRRCAETFSVSRTTAEAAYFQLCADGYVLAKPKSGYYVTDLYFRKPQKKTAPNKSDAPAVRYDFASLSAALIILSARLFASDKILSVIFSAPTFLNSCHL